MKPDKVKAALEQEVNRESRPSPESESQGTDFNSASIASSTGPFPAVFELNMVASVSRLFLTSRPRLRLSSLYFSTPPYKTFLPDNIE
jgi:hypothetical protein